ncbi:MAG: hypothetical protein HN833_03775 [Elusimicrobiaceae bacterium]|jgi:hypothetical protein|nr:hypothetical protein [Elusimicrobiaceae bacterium]MBT4008505.1 hypothetical protein [Elusimicrobiaceae bacterium]MBT4403393.1 hypothetical protein [Elusimicrobiaceae bacterium]MBT4440234.1 hypothetical protein [Elusimicrobiaceae bacterium]MBT5987658.1 hypothetical protein [Elusimicrobiaceae bacterium]
MKNIIKIILPLMVVAFVSTNIQAQFIIPSYDVISAKVSIYLMEREKLADKEKRKELRMNEMKEWPETNLYLDKIEKIQDILDNHDNEEVRLNMVFYTKDFSFVEYDGIYEELEKFVSMDFLNIPAEKVKKISGLYSIKSEGDVKTICLYILWQGMIYIEIDKSAKTILARYPKDYRNSYPKQKWDIQKPPAMLLEVF